MAYTPRLPFEIFAELLARVISTSRVLTDMAEGSVIGTILGSVAEEVSAVERRIKEFVDAYYLRGTGVNLDRRLDDFPPGFPRRRTATPAVGGACRVVRTSNTGTTVLPAGSLIVQASSLREVTYTNLVTVTIGPGDYSAIDIPFIALTPGAIGNLSQPSLINTIVRGLPELVEVTNTQPLAGGTDRERDDELRQRAERWVASLALAQNEALEAVALNFQASNSTVASHARIWNDPDMRGYSELVVDDGTGMQGYTRLAQTTTGVVPTLSGSGLRYQFPFEWPAATPPVVRIDGNIVPPSSYQVLHDKGLIVLNEFTPYAVSPGMPWSVGDHSVFVGFIAELQRYINTICVAAGTVVRVVSPIPQYINLSFNMVAAPGTNLVDVREQIKRAIVAFVARLAPGEPLLIYRLIGSLNALPGVLNVVFDQTDRYPGSIKHKLVARLSDITGR
jgi:hypothetical protein